MNPGEPREKSLERVMSRHQYSGSSLIEVLHAAQQLYGYLSKPLLDMVAHKLRLPPSKVLGVATFYHLFRFEPVKEHSAVVCLGTACYAAGGPGLMSTVKKRCPKATWTVEAGRCVGSCGLAPVVICDGEPLSRVTPEELETRLGGSSSDSVRMLTHGGSTEPRPSGSGLRLGGSSK
jgi:bidirectional [NiFe] hydrogenase diaphorase subunit